MSDNFDQEFEDGGGISKILTILGPLVVIVAAIIFWRSRSQTKDDRAFAPIVNAIADAEIPDRAKDMLFDAVDDVRGALTHIREMAVELTERG
jgi:hypothetical protein